MSPRDFPDIAIAILGVALAGGCASDSRETTVSRTETTTTTVRSSPAPPPSAAPVTPDTNLGQCYMLTHDAPLILAHPQRHLAVVPATADVLPDDVLRGTLRAGTRLKLTQVKGYESRGGAEARFTFARVEDGPHVGAIVATDRIGVNYAGSLSTHAQAVPCP